MQQAQRQQAIDQSSKGGVLGILSYLMFKGNIDPALIAMSMPLLAALLSWASTRIGDPQVASFFGTVGVNDGKIVKVAAKKAPAKKAAKKPLGK